MPGVVWFGLITGAVVTVGMIFALQIRRTARELILAGLFSALIAFLLFLIWDFDAPYSRGITATADPFLDLFPARRGRTGARPPSPSAGRCARRRGTRCPIRATAIAGDAHF